MELLTVEYAKLPEVMRALAGVWTAFHRRATDPVEGVPLPPGVMHALEALATVQLRCADAAEKITPLAIKLCQAKIDELQDQRNRMWDHRANRGHAA
jgi:hypothetical protein